MGSKKRLPQMAGGSASALSLSRPAQASLALRPAGSLRRAALPSRKPASYTGVMRCFAGMRTISYTKCQADALEWLSTAAS